MCTCQCPDKWEQPSLGAVLEPSGSLLLSPPVAPGEEELGFFWNRLQSTGCVGEAGLVCGML